MNCENNFKSSYLSNNNQKNKSSFIENLIYENFGVFKSNNNNNQDLINKRNKTASKYVSGCNDKSFFWTKIN